MNLIQQAENLKNLPDQALAQMQQRPTDTPPYLVVAEMQRRANMRKAYEASSQMPRQPPVAQQMAQQMQPPMQQQQQQPPPMQMAGGGLASLAGYFDQMQGGGDLPSVDPSMIGVAQYPGDPRWDEMRKFKVNAPRPKSQSDYFKEMQEQLGESPLKAIADKLGTDETAMRGQKPKLSDILMQLGLGMAASRRPDFAGAIGEGGIGALQGYKHERDRTQALADRIAEKRLRALEGAQRHTDRVQDYAIDAARSAQSGYNTDRANDTNIELGIMRQQKEEELAQKLAERQITQQQAAMELAEFNKRADADRRMGEKEYDRETQLEVQRLRNQRPRGNGAASDKMDPSAIRLIGVYSDMANDYEKQAMKLNETLQNPLLPKEQKPVIAKRIEDLNAQATQLRQRTLMMANSMAGIKDSPQSVAPATGKMTAEEFLSKLPSGAPTQQQQGPGILERLGAFFNSPAPKPSAPVPWNR